MNPNTDPPSAGALFGATKPAAKGSNPYLHPVGFPQGQAQQPANPYLMTQAASMPPPPSFAPTPAPGYSPSVMRHQPPAGPVPYQGAAQQQFGAFPQQTQQQQQQQQQHPLYYYGSQTGAPQQQPQGYRGQPQQPQQVPQYYQQQAQNQAYYYQQQGQPQQHQQQQQQQQSSHWGIEYSDLQMGTELGRGAFGIVYKGRWRLTDVAIKVSQGKLSAEDLATFQKETTLMMNLRPHKNVVQLRGVCQNPLCVVIDFVEGGSLEKRLHDRTKEVGWKKIFQFGQGIVAGMLHIHLEGIVHRDLASRNVLLDALDTPLIADFGLSAQTFGQLQEKGFFRGPYKWMAPESLAANQFSVASDVWSFGVTMWEVLSRRLPFEDKDIYQVRDEVVRTRLRLPLHNKWPEMWRNLLMACWRTDPAMRPDMATIGGWLHQMKLDFDQNPTAGAYALDPALSDEEMRPLVPTAVVAAPATGVAPAVVLPSVPEAAPTAAVVAAPVVAPVISAPVPVAEGAANVSLHSSFSNTDSNASHALNSSAGPSSTQNIGASLSSPLPTATAVGGRRLSTGNVTKSDSGSLLHASAGTHNNNASNNPAPSPASPSMRRAFSPGPITTGKIFDSIAHLGEAESPKLQPQVVDARPDKPHAPVPEEK